MDRHFIVSALEGITVSCLYYGYKKENVITNHCSINCGVQITITDEGRFVLGKGWYILIILNHSKIEYVSLQDLEKAINNQDLYSEIDLEIDLATMRYQINKALDERNEEKFKSAAKKLKELLVTLQKIKSPLSI